MVVIWGKKNMEINQSVIEKKKFATENPFYDAAS